MYEFFWYYTNLTHFFTLLVLTRVINLVTLFNEMNISLHMTGRVKWFDDKRGYGFITTDEGVDVYVHYTAIVTDGYRTLKHNWRTSFDVVTTEDGRTEARNVVVLPKIDTRKESKRNKR